MISVEFVQGKLTKMKEALAGVEKLFVLTHDNPDPDSISCAVTLAAIVTQLFGVNAVARYNGIVGRAENREMIRSLKLGIKRLKKNEIKSGDAVALVDCQPGTGNVTLPKNISPLIIVDHHTLRESTKCAFADVRDEYGATATVVAEYLMVSGLTITTQLATALSYGISSETQKLGREATPHDLSVYLAVFADASKKILAQIEFPKLKRHYFTTLNRALHQAAVYKNAVVSYIGDIDEPDFVPIVADLLIRCERISWSLVLGRYKHKIVVSLRTTKKNADAGKFLRQLVGKRGTAGGHDMIAGGQIPCSRLSEGGCETLQKEIMAAFFKKIGHKDVTESTPLLLQESTIS